jgi:flavorubredoxin
VTASPERLAGGVRALVVYESLFGNTEAVARAVAAGLASSPHVSAVDVVEVHDAPASVPAGVNLVVVGGPTHAFGLTRASTRADALRRSTTAAPARATTVGLREWLDGLAPAADRLAVAATFDSRVRRPRVPGSAARGALRRLRRLGFAPADRPVSFWVDGVAGPLKAGELDRARAWGGRLGHCLPSAARSGSDALAR